MKFKIEDIKRYLRELDFEWVDTMIHDHVLDRYRSATINSFKGKPIYIYLRNLTTKKYASALTTITDNSFIIKHGGSKLDASEGWVDFLKENLTKEASGE